jgi:hypothetical protein
VWTDEEYPPPAKVGTSVGSPLRRLLRFVHCAPIAVSCPFARPSSCYRLGISGKGPGRKKLLNTAVGEALCQVLGM